MCLRVAFCTERLEIDANVTNFAGSLHLHLFFTQSIWVVLSNRLNMVKFIPIKIISLVQHDAKNNIVTLSMSLICIREFYLHVK